MATTSYVTGLEDRLVDCKSTAARARLAYEQEGKNEGKHGRCSPQNRDVWGTLRLNALALRAELDALLDAMKPEFDA